MITVTYRDGSIQRFDAEPCGDAGGGHWMVLLNKGVRVAWLAQEEIRSLYFGDEISERRAACRAEVKEL